MIGVIFAHIFAKTEIDNLTKFQEVVYNSIPKLMGFTVPVFVMISGALLIPREEGYKKTLIRCRILVFSLLVFGIPAAMLENIFRAGNFSVQMIGQAVVDIISGNSWDVFWYIYMIIGIYLILPFLREGLNKNPSKTFYLCIILFIFVALIPTINEIAKGNLIGFYLPVNSIGLLYAVTGHFIANVADKDKLKKLVLPSIIFVCLFVACMILNFSCGWNLEAIITSDVITFICSGAVFLIGMTLFTKESKIISKLSECSFGIYLVHCYFINFIYKFLDITLVEFPLILSVPIMFITVISLSVITVRILLKIPVVKKYIL